MTIKEVITKNSYYLLSKEFLLGAMTISRSKSGKYYLTKKEAKNGFYVELKEANINLKVPFSALFVSNKKIKDIKSISFSSAIFCPSHQRGLCQLKNANISCYAKIGERRASKTVTKKGFLCLNSYYHSILTIKCLKIITTNNKLLKKFFEYIDNNIKTLRFNLKGDFKNRGDYLLLVAIALNCPKTTIYGYTARDDLFDYYNPKSSPKNLFLNGSNKKYDNRFKTTYDLKEFITSRYNCLGDCLKCKKCYTLHNKTIVCLLHGIHSKKILNTFNNRLFLATLFNAFDKTLNLKESDFKIKSDLLEAINLIIKDNIGVDNLSFSSFLEFKEWLLTLHFEIKDNIDTIGDYEYLRGLGIA